MKERKFSLGVFVCIFNKDISKILLIKRNKQKVSTYLGEWGNVGGKIEPGEYSIDAAIREASEEISVNLEKKNLKQIAIVENPDNPIFKNWHVIHIVYAAIIPENTKIILNDESEDYCWFDLNNLPEKMLDSKEDILKFANKARELFRKL